MFNVNGPPKGSNVSSDQSSYDLVYQDIIINYGNVSGSSSAADFSIELNTKIDRLYKAELVNASIQFGKNGSGSPIPTSVQNSCILLSIKQLNGNTSILPVSSSTSGSPSFFCQIADNVTPLYANPNTDHNVVSMLITCTTFSAVQYYNPPLSKILNKLDIKLYGSNGVALESSGTGTDIGKVINTYLTIRLYYFQKRNIATAFSVPVVNYAASGTIDSIFSNN